MWVEHQLEREMFRVERHLLYASHAAVVTHWEQQKGTAAGKKAAKAKKKPNPKPDDDPPAEPAPNLAKPESTPEAKQAPQPKPEAPLEAALLGLEVREQPSAKPAAEPRAQTHPQAPDGSKPRPRPPFGNTRQTPALRFGAARTSKDKGQRKAWKWTRQIEN